MTPALFKIQINDKLVDNRHLRRMNFWSISQISLKLASCGIHRQIERSPFCRVAKCQFCNILWCRKFFVFLTKNDQRLFSSNAVFTDRFRVLLSVELPNVSSVTFFDVEKSLCFWPKTIKGCFRQMSRFS